MPGMMASATALYDPLRLRRLVAFFARWTRYDLPRIFRSFCCGKLYGAGFVLDRDCLKKTHPYPLVLVFRIPRRTRIRQIRSRVAVCVQNDDHLPKTVREYREKYKGVGRILDEHPEILELAHQDLKKLSAGESRGVGEISPRRRCCGPCSSRQSKGSRCGRPWCGSPRASSSRTFCGRERRRRWTNFLDRCFQAIRPATWKRMNALLGGGSRG